MTCKVVISIYYKIGATMNYIKIMITVCILSYQNNLLISGDDVDQKLSIEYTRAEKIVRHLTKELQILEKEIKSKQIDYQPTLDEIKHEISLLENMIINSPEFHEDVAKNIKGGQAYLKWFSLDYVRKKIKEETDKHQKDIAKKAAKKISLQKQKNKDHAASKKPKNSKKICKDTTLQQNIIVPVIVEAQIPEAQPLIDQTPLPVCNEQNNIQAPWYYPSQLYKNLQIFTYNMYQYIIDSIKFIGNINS